MENNFTYYDYIDPFSSIGQLGNTITIEDILDITKVPTYSKLDYIESKINNPKSKDTSWFKEGVISSTPTSTSDISSTESGSTTYKSKSKWVQAMKNAYEEALKEKGIDTKYAKNLIAQDALESGWGKHLSGKNNFGGVKGKGTKQKTKEYSKEKGTYTTQSEFRDFDSLKDYAKYKVDLLNNNRYHAFDGGDFNTNVAKGGYATDPTYKQKLDKIYDSV